MEERNEGGREEAGRCGGKETILDPSYSILLMVHAMELTQIGSLGIWAKICHIYTEFIQELKGYSEPQDKNSLENLNFKSIHNLRCLQLVFSQITFESFA